MRNILEKKIVRRRDAMKELGLTAREFEKLVECGILKPMAADRGRAWFRMSDIQKLLE